MEYAFKDLKEMADWMKGQAQNKRTAAAGSNIAKPRARELVTEATVLERMAEMLSKATMASNIKVDWDDKK